MVKSIWPEDLRKENYPRVDLNWELLFEERILNEEIEFVNGPERGG